MGIAQPAFYPMQNHFEHKTKKISKVEQLSGNKICFEIDQHILLLHQQK